MNMNRNIVSKSKLILTCNDILESSMKTKKLKTKINKETNKGQTITLQSEVKEVEVHKLNEEAKKQSQRVTKEELEKLMPMMAGKKVTKEENDWAEELMERDVNLGSVIQAVALMVAPMKHELLDDMYMMLDNQDVFKRTLIRMGATDKMFKEVSDEIVKERDEAREKAQKLAKEASDELKSKK